MTELFNDDETPVVDNAYETLVGEGKKFSDQEALAKGKLESDRFIEKLIKEQQEMREELNKRMSAAEVAEQIKRELGTRPATTPNPNPDSGERDDDVTGLSPEDVEKVVENKINAHQQKELQKANIDYVRSELEKAWGPNYSARLKTIVSAVGLGEDFANGFAATKPKAFLKMVLEQKSEVADTAPPRGSFRPTPSAGGRPKYKDYEKMRREDPKKYFTPSVQNEMYKALAEMGDDFYN